MGPLFSELCDCILSLSACYVIFEVKSFTSFWKHMDSIMVILVQSFLARAFPFALAASQGSDMVGTINLILMQVL